MYVMTIVYLSIQNIGYVDHKNSFSVNKKYWKIMDLIFPRKEWPHVRWNLAIHVIYCPNIWWERVGLPNFLFLSPRLRFPSPCLPLPCEFTSAPRSSIFFSRFPFLWSRFPFPSLPSQSYPLNSRFLYSKCRSSWSQIQFSC